jgi:phosphomannomutase
MVGGSDLVKQREQLGEDVLELFDFVFPENGLAAFQLGKSIGKTSFRDFLGEARLKELINFVLLYIANLDIPIKRGTFIEFRNGMLNVSPIGRNCSQEERDEFERYDLANGIRATMVKVLEARFANFGLKYSIGGQISFDVFPIVSSPGTSPMFWVNANAHKIPYPQPNPSSSPAGLGQNLRAQVCRRASQRDPLLR